MEPLEVKLTGRRRVVLDHVEGGYRVAYYAPENVERALELERRERRGSRDAGAELDKLGIVRTTGKAELLSDALVDAMTRKDPDNPLLMRRPRLADVVQIRDYILATGQLKPHDDDPRSQSDYEAFGG